jgi:hypothetical protein
MVCDRRDAAFRKSDYFDSGDLFVITLKMPVTGAVRFWLAINAT